MPIERNFIHNCIVHPACGLIWLVGDISEFMADSITKYSPDPLPDVDAKLVVILKDLKADLVKLGENLHEEYPLETEAAPEPAPEPTS